MTVPKAMPLGPAMRASSQSRSTQTNAAARAMGVGTARRASIRELAGRLRRCSPTASTVEPHAASINPELSLMVKQEDAPCIRVPDVDPPGCHLPGRQSRTAGAKKVMLAPRDSDAAAIRTLAMPAHPGSSKYDHHGYRLLQSGQPQPSFVDNP